MGTDGNSGDVFMIWNYFDIHQRYSIVAALNNGKDFCVSDSAASSGNTTWFNGWDGSSPPPFGTKGCMYNP